jgi:putative membrane protein
MTSTSVIFTLAAGLASIAFAGNTVAPHNAGGDWGKPSGQGQTRFVAVRESATTLSEADKAFIREAGAGNLYEIDAGQKAVAKATDNGVKTIGQRMIDDHTRLNNELTTFASSKGYNETPALTAMQHERLAKLDKLNGTAFDREFVKLGIKDHRKDIAKYDHEAAHAHDPGLRDWAGKSLPTLREHLTMFEDRGRALGVEKTTGAMSGRRPGFYPGQSDPTGVRIQPSNPNSDSNSSR